jgi:uncharacterized protein (TIGR02246 family)
MLWAAVIESAEDLHGAFQAAFNRGDLDAVVALYEPDAVLISFDGSIVGLSAIRERYRFILATYPTITLQTLSVSSAGGLALLHGQWSLRETGPDGMEVRRHGRNAEVARRQTDGAWLFVIDTPSIAVE